MLYFLDTEFIESGPSSPIHLISIAIVAEDGRELYRINSDCPFDKANEWVKANVYPAANIEFNEMGGVWTHNWTKSGRDGVSFSSFCLLRRTIIDFIGDDSNPEFWAYYADYDWVVFCQIFGTMMDLPKDFPMYCKDIKQLCDDLGNPNLPEQDSNEHHALADARWNKQAYEFLTNRQSTNKHPTGVFNHMLIESSRVKSLE